MSTLSFLVFLSKILQIHYGTVRRRLRMLKETKICRSVNKFMLQPVLCLMVVSHLCLISQYCTYRLTVNDPSSSHAGASEPTLPNDSDQDCQMDVSPPNNRSTSSGIGFGLSSGQASQGAGSFHPSTPVLSDSILVGLHLATRSQHQVSLPQVQVRTNLLLFPFPVPTRFRRGYRSRQMLISSIPILINLTSSIPISLFPSNLIPTNSISLIPIRSISSLLRSISSMLLRSISPIPISSISRRPVSSTSRCPVSSTSRRPISSIHRHSVHLLCLLHLPQWFSLLELHLR